LSTSGSISFGCAFVAGRKRVPRPAAGKTAFRSVLNASSKLRADLKVRSTYFRRTLKVRPTHDLRSALHTTSGGP